MRQPRDLVFRAGLVIGALLLVTAGAITWTQWPQTVDRGSIPSATVHRGSTGSTPGATTRPRRQGRTLSPTGQRRPIQLHIPSLRVDAPVVPVTVDAQGALDVPPDPSRVGWWSDGPAPGAPRGTAVIDGHVDWAGIGPGALFHLRELKVGARVIVDEIDGPARFQVVAVREYAKARLPWRQIFDQSVTGRLVIVSCGGRFDPKAHSYLDNIVAYAVPVAA